MSSKNNNKRPVWLENSWEQRKQITVKRVKNAIEQLIKDNQAVSIRTICDMVREQTGHSLSPNTIKQNSSAYELYCQNTSYKHILKLKDPNLLLLLDECSASKRQKLLAKISRLKQKSKDELIARLIRLEYEVKESRAFENSLRERLIEVEISLHKRKTIDE